MVKNTLFLLTKPKNSEDAITASFPSSLMAGGSLSAQAKALHSGCQSI
jgi:hypothetical protein